MNVGDADPAAHDAIYMTGGHGVCFDFPTSAALAELTARFYEMGKVVSAVCHGPAGLLEVKVGGDYLIKGKDVTGFSWTEEGLAKREKAVPYSLEEELKKRGAKYDKSSIPFKGHVVEDGLLITGQRGRRRRGRREEAESGRVIACRNAVCFRFVAFHHSRRHR